MKDLGIVKHILVMSIVRDKVVGIFKVSKEKYI